MSALAFIDNRRDRRRERPAARARGCLASLALLVPGAAFAQATNSIDQVTVSKGASGRTIVQLPAEERRPPIRRPASRSRARRGSRSTSSTRQRARRDPARRRRRRAAQPQRHPGGQPDARRVQPQPAADVRDAGRGQRGAGDADRPGAISSMRKRRRCSASPRREPGDTQHALRDVDFRRGRNGEGRIVVDLSDSATGIDIRQQGQHADRRLHQDVAAAQPRAAPRRRRTSARRSSPSTRSRRARTRAWSSSRRGCGSTRPTRRTTASSSR